MKIRFNHFLFFLLAAIALIFAAGVFEFHHIVQFADQWQHFSIPMLPFLGMPFSPNRKIQLRDIQGIGAGNTAIINCPKGPRYKYIGIILGNSAAGNGNAPAISAITAADISVVLGTKTIRRATGTQIDFINTGMGANFASVGFGGGANGTGRTILPIYFEEPWRNRADYQNGLALETGWLDQNGVFQIKVPLVAGITPVVQAFAIVDDFNTGKPNPIVKWYSDDANTTAAVLDLANIFQGAPANDLVSQITCFNTSDAQAVTQVRLMLNGIAVYDDVTANENITLLTQFNMNPQAGAYHIVFDHDDLFESLRQIGAITNSQLTLTLAGASTGTLRRVTQRLGDPTA